MTASAEWVLIAGQMQRFVEKYVDLLNKVVFWT